MPRNVSNTLFQLRNERRAPCGGTRRSRGFWLVTGGWLWNYRWWEPFGESRRHSMHRSSSARISLSSKIAYIGRRQNVETYACGRSSCTGLSNYSVFFTAGASARTVPKNWSQQSSYFQLFGNFRECAFCFRAGKCLRLEHPAFREDRPPGAARFLQTTGCQVCPLRPFFMLCGGASGLFFSGAQAVAFQVAVQAGSPNSQELRGP